MPLSPAPTKTLTTKDSPPVSAPELSVVIPCFNERDAIEGILVDLIRDVSAIEEYELIIVDDGSTDGSSEILERLAREFERVNIVAHAKNRGYGAALKTGIRRAVGTFIAITDADGTYPNRRIPDLLALCRNADMVIGARTGENVTYSKIRKIPKVFLRAYCEWIAQTEIPDFNSGLRVFRKEVVCRFLPLLPNGFSFTTTITLAMLTNDYLVRFEPIDYSARLGKSKISPIRDTLRFIQLIFRTALYFAPLRVFSPFIVVCWLGFFAGLGFDLINLGNLSEKTVLLLLLAANLTTIALLADMIDKRLQQ